MSTWKKLTIGALAAGFGVGLAASLAVGGYIWCRSRPRPPAPWNSAAIRAEFDTLGTEGDQPTIAFDYTLENTTRFDYRVADVSGLSLAGKLKKENSLSLETDEKILRVDLPIFIPAGQRLRFRVHLGYPYPGKTLPDDASADERKRYYDGLKNYVAKDLANLNGFVLFDETHRYEIDLPRGW